MTDTGHNKSGIGFWVKTGNHCFTAQGGLTIEQIAVLHNLQVGDRLVLLRPKPEYIKDTTPTYILKQAIDRPHELPTAPNPALPTGDIPNGPDDDIPF